MCIAIFVPKGTVIPKQHLINGQAANPDGCGMAWVENGKVQIFKTMSFAVWMAAYDAVVERLGYVNMLIHFRITSRGETSEEMCHPFMVDEDTCIIHNGTITAIKAAEHGTDSDTKFLAEQILSDLPPRWYENLAIGRLLEDFIGWSKIAVLNSDDEVYIFNETEAQWDAGIWYSNSGYKHTPYNYQKVTPITLGLPAKTLGTGADDYYQSGHYDSEPCDGCFKTFNYSKLSYHDGGLMCESCIDKSKAAAAQRRALVYANKGKPADTKTFTPCGCCRSLTDVQDMWTVQIELWQNYNEHPEQLDTMQIELIRSVEDEKYLIEADLCHECFLWAKDCGHSGFRDVEVLLCSENHIWDTDMDDVIGGI